MHDAASRRLLAGLDGLAARPVLRLSAAATVAAISVLIAVGVRLELDVWLQGATYMPFFLAVIFSAWAGGLFGGMIGVLLSALACDYLLMGPVSSFAIDTTSDRISLAMFCFTASVVCLVAEAMHRARARAEQQASALRIAERELRIRDEQIERALEVGRIVTWDFNLDTGELRHSSSASASATLGGERLTLAAVLELVLPEERERITAIVRNVIAGGEAHRVELPLRGPDGEVRWFSNRATLRIDPQNSQRHLTGLASDISDRKRAELALGASEGRFRTLVETIPQLVWMARPDGEIFWFNQRWYDYTGSTFDQMKDGGWTSVHDPSKLPEVMETWNRSLAAGSAMQITFPLRSADGSYRLFLTRVVPYKDEQDRVLYWFGTNIDISELQALQDQLKAEDRRKDEFLATLAHELRNPLAPLVTGLDLLDAMQSNTAAIVGVRQIMQRQLTRMSRLLDDLQDVSRIARGALELRKTRVLLSDALTDAVEASQPAIEQGEHRLELVQGPDPVALMADPHRLTQIFSNLLNNAARYTDPHGLIRVVVERGPHEVAVRVIDTGIGMAPSAISQLFKIFSQLAPTSGRSRSGLGIGLSLVKRLVELHGGTVSASSEGLGKGSEFAVRLPIADEEAGLQAASPISAPETVVP